MKRVLSLKWGLVTIAALLALSAGADVYVPPPRTMSHAEWMMAMGHNAASLRFAVPCFALAVLLAAWCVSVRRKRPSVMVCLACCAPAILFLPIVHGRSWFDITFLSAFGVSAVSWIISVVSYFRIRKSAKGVGVLLAIPVVFVAVTVAGIRVNKSRSYLLAAGDLTYRPPVDPRPGETYDEYVKRANRIIYHHCPKCDKPMQSAYYYGCYWYCDACGYNKDFERRQEKRRNSQRNAERQKETENQ